MGRASLPRFKERHRPGTSTESPTVEAPIADALHEADNTLRPCTAAAASAYDRW